MTDVVGVLLVPAEGDPLGLLQEGPCGRRPPMAWRGEGMWFAWDHPDNPDTRTHLLDGTEALVLAWEGELLSEACRLVDPQFDRWTAAVRLVLKLGKTGGFGNHLVGAIILLDADGREVSS